MAYKRIQSGKLAYKVCRCIAINSTEDFTPESVPESSKGIKDMDVSENEEYRKELEAQKEKIRSGYQRIKEERKSIRHDCRRCMNKSTTSGNGKTVQDSCDLQTDIWGGAPATKALSFGIDGDTISFKSDDEQEGQTKMYEGAIIYI